MLELKIQCDCGQKYKFDVEPVDGRMPWEVNCPICGASGTASCNELLRQMSPVAAPSMVAAASEPPQPRLVVNRTHAPSAPAATLEAPPAEQYQMADAQLAADVDEHGRPRNFTLSLTGVVLGAVLGMLIWHLICRTTGIRLGIMALVTGVMAGVAPQLIGYYRSKLMGLLAAVCALTAILGAQFMNAKVEVDRFVDETESEGYASEFKRAKAAVAAVPNGTDEEIRAFLARDYSDDDDEVKPEDIGEDDIKEFREEFPRMRDLASGKITKAEYGKELRQTSEEVQDSGFFKIYLLIRTIGIFNIVNIILGVGAAYLTAKGP
jgi:hypothetical protein